MIEKKTYLEKLKKTEAIFSSYDFLNKKISSLSSIKDTIDDFAFRVVFVGGFSSGKSALLNKLIGKDLFKEDQGPETSLPAEVSWAPVESACITYNNGETKFIENIDSATNNPPMDALCLCFHLPHNFLKQRPELILVDFPGFDSNVDAHNKAINSYLQKGSAFILFVPASNGTLGQSDIKFLKEATHYPQSLACFISKSDLRPTEESNEVINYVKKGIKNVYGVDVPVKAISSREDKFGNVEEVLGEIVDNFDPQELFNISLAPLINEELNFGIDALDKYMNTVGMDEREIDERISNAKETLDNLTLQLEKEKRNLDNKYKYEIIPNIINRLNNTLKDNINTLTDAAMGGEQRFADATQALIRPILATIPSTIQTDLRNTIGTMQIAQVSGTKQDDDEAIKQSLLNIVDVISTFIPQGGGNLSRATGRQPGFLSTQGPNMIAGLGGGAVLASLGNPILGIIVGVAPMLIDIFFGSRNKSPQPDPKLQARAQVEAAIPAILNRLEGQITPAILEMRDNMFAEIKEKIDENINAATEAMEQAKKEKIELKSQHEKMLKQIDMDITALKEMYIETHEVA